VVAFKESRARRPAIIAHRFVVTYAPYRDQMYGTKEERVRYSCVVGYDSTGTEPVLSPTRYGSVATLNVRHAWRAAQPKERLIPMKNSAQSLALAAAFAGLLGGTSVRLNAQQVQVNGTPTASQSSQAGVLLVQSTQPDLPKHSCKGKNDCKGQGGGKNAGKNDCKGKGGCATDGSKPPKKA